MQNNIDKNSESFRESIRLTAEHYDPQAYDSRRAIASMPFGVRERRLRFRTVAASVAATLLAAAAVVAVVEFNRQPTPAPVPVEKTAPAPKPVEDLSKKVERLEFTDAPVSRVVQKIENVYGVRLSNLPPDDPRLTLSYTGTAADLVETINTMLGCDIRIENDSEKK